MRKNFDETVSFLHEENLIWEDEQPVKPSSMPHYDDEDDPGISFLKTKIESAKLNNLDMQYTFFSHSEIRDCQFQNTDLSESNFCWNDFIEVTFDQCDLKESDMRASLFEKVRFINTDLSSSDLRHSKFKECSFEGCKMDQVMLTKNQSLDLMLSEEQIKAIAWQETEGEEPAGG